MKKTSSVIIFPLITLIFFNKCHMNEYELADLRDYKNDSSLSMVLETNKSLYTLNDTISLKIIVFNNSKKTVMFRKQNILFQVYNHLKLTDWHEEPIYPLYQVDYTTYNEGLEESLVLFGPADSLIVEVELDNSVYKISTKPDSLSLYIIYFNRVAKFKDLDLWVGVLQSDLISVEFIKD